MRAIRSSSWVHRAAVAGSALVALAGLPRADEAPGEDALPSIPPPDAAAAWVAEGFAVEVAAAGLMYPSSIEFDDQGAMLVAECGYMPGDTSEPARVLRLRGPTAPRDGEPRDGEPRDGELRDGAPADGAGAEREVLVEGLSAPVTDLLWHGGRLFISHKGKISVWRDGKLADLVTGLPSLGDHSNNQMAIGPDGKLYFGQGSATNSGVVGPDNFAFGWPKEHPDVCEVPARDVKLTGEVFESVDPRAAPRAAGPGTDGAAADAPTAKTSAFMPFGQSAAGGTVKGRTKANGAILRCALDGTGLEVFAWGFRNPYGLAWGADGRLYVADAGSDERGSRPIANAPEKLFVAREGAWYGWPDYEGGVPVTDPRFRSALGPAPRFLLREHPEVEAPLATLEPHASITQMAVSPGGAFGGDGQIYLASSGDQSAVTASRELRAGYWVVRIHPGQPTPQPFFHAQPAARGPKGLEYVTTAGPKRLVDVRFSPQGDALYVVDIGPIHYVRGEQGPEPKAFKNTGVIWRITRKP